MNAPVRKAKIKAIIMDYLEVNTFQDIRSFVIVDSDKGIQRTGASWVLTWRLENAGSKSPQETRVFSFLFFSFHFFSFLSFRHTENIASSLFPLQGKMLQLPNSSPPPPVETFCSPARRGTWSYRAQKIKVCLCSNFKGPRDFSCARV